MRKLKVIRIIKEEEKKEVKIVPFWQLTQIGLPPEESKRIRKVIGEINDQN